MPKCAVGHHPAPHSRGAGAKNTKILRMFNFPLAKVPPQRHNARFTNFRPDLRGSTERNLFGASSYLMCSYGDFGSKRVFWHETRSCRAFGIGSSASP